MKHAEFVHLHCHTEYSLLDGACRISDLTQKAAELNMPAIAMTDHGNMSGAIEFYQAAQQAGVQPIIGCEAYIAPNSRFERSSHGIREASYHIVLLAQNNTGYRNLMKLVSAGYLEGFYYKPRIDKELLAEHVEGLIGLSSSLRGEVPHLLLTEQEQAARRAAGELRDIFGPDNFYLELMYHNLEPEKKVDNGLLRLSQELDIPVVATNDVHYVAQASADAHDALLCIGTQSSLDDPHRFRYASPEFYLKSADEMLAALGSVPDAIRNTIAIAERCNLELDFTQVHLPQFEPPHGQTREAFLRSLCADGLQQRYESVNETVEARLEHELQVINDAGYTSYFLIAWDFVSHAKQRKIPVGPGRGSAAGCLVSYLLGITDIDPLRYDLLFERFLNPDRVSLPDIDIDFCYERRNEVIQYVTEKYGTDHVAQIITFGTMMAKAVVRDVGRVIGMPYGEVDRIAKLIPNDLNITLEEALAQSPPLKELYDNDQQVTRLIDLSKPLEGLARHASTHAAGVVIGDRQLTDHLPLYKTNDDQITTGFPMKSLEKIGLLKIDFLGLRTLTVVDETLKIIRRTQDRELNIDTISLEDTATYALLGRGEAVGVFQLESGGMRDLLRKLKPNQFGDLIALLALYRPGPIGSGMVDDFIKRRRGQVTIRYDHPLLEPILKSTYGIILYQEQVMQISNELAGFSLSQADSLRRAMAKKTPEVLEAQRKAFIDGCRENNIQNRVASRTFDLIEYFAGYGFNKSHSTAYAMISYRTAYLKANFPTEFMAALLTSERNNTDKVVSYINEASRMSIQMLPPDVNESLAFFTVTGPRAIRFGLAAVKNVGQGAVEAIAEARQAGGPFSSLYDFCERIDLQRVNRKVIECLIKCGALDGLDGHRAQLTAALDQACELASHLQRDRSQGQISFFDAGASRELFRPTAEELPKMPEWPEHQRLTHEKELLGFYLTGHPLKRYTELLQTFATHTVSTLRSGSDGDIVMVGGIIAKCRHTTTKAKNEQMGIVLLEDLEGLMEVLVFPSAYQQCVRALNVGNVVLVIGRLNLREDEPKIMANDVVAAKEVRSRCTEKIHVDLVGQTFDEAMMHSLRDVMQGHRGETPVWLHLAGSDEAAQCLQVQRECFVTPSEDLLRALHQCVGTEAVRVEAKPPPKTPKNGARRRAR